MQKEKKCLFNSFYPGMHEHEGISTGLFLCHSFNCGQKLMTMKRLTLVQSWSFLTVEQTGKILQFAFRGFLCYAFTTLTYAM